MDNKTIKPDEFALALNEILSEIDEEVNGALCGAIQEGLKVGKNAVVKNALDQKLYRSKSSPYIKSWRRAFSNSKRRPEGTIYSTMYQLPHLLEKGHATIGGGFVSGRPHVLPAAKVAFDTTLQVLEERINEVLPE